MKVLHALHLQFVFQHSRRFLISKHLTPSSTALPCQKKESFRKGPAVCGTVARGNLAMMRLLVELEANLNGRLVSFNGEPNVTLLYDASYFGHAHLAACQRR